MVILTMRKSQSHKLPDPVNKVNEETKLTQIKQGFYLTHIVNTEWTRNIEDSHKNPLMTQDFQKVARVMG